MTTTMSTATRLAALLALPLALSACGSNREPLTYGDRDQGDSAQAVAEDVAVLNLRVLPPAEGLVHPAGSDARVGLTLVNEATEDDALLSATTDAAASVALTVDTVPADRLPVAARKSSPAGYSLVLRGLTRELRSGQTIRLSLVFERAPKLDVVVPVSTPTVVIPRASANPKVNEPAHGGGGEGHDEVENVVEKAGEAHSEGGAEGSSGH